MKSVIASLVAVAGMSVAANAIVNSQVDFLVSVDGGPFQSSVNILAGTGSHTVEVLTRVTYTGQGTPLGLASANFQPTVSNWTGADAAVALTANVGNNTSGGAVADAPGQYGRISPFARTAFTTSNSLNFFTHTAGAGGAPAGSWLRIAQRTATSWIGGTGNTTGGQGLNLAQLNNVGRTASDPAFNPGLSVNTFRWAMTINSGPLDASSVRTLTIDAPAAGFGNRDATTGERQIYWFADMTESTGSIRGAATVNDGFINIIVPSPASLALMGLGGLCVARRRR